LILKQAKCGPGDQAALKEIPVPAELLATDQDRLQGSIGRTLIVPLKVSAGFPAMRFRLGK